MTPAAGGAAPGSLLLFVSGVAGPPADRTRDVVGSVWSRVIGAQTWIRIGGTPAPTADAASVWHLDPQETACVDMVEEALRGSGRSVALINVNAPGAQRDLVTRWIGENDVFPVLVRPDGQRLVGLSAFDPRTVRRFVRA